MLAITTRERKWDNHTSIPVLLSIAGNGKDEKDETEVRSYPSWIIDAFITIRGLLE